MSGEELLKQKMAEGWNINIECKGKGRVYEMSYEGTAAMVGTFLGDDNFVLKHGVGDTLKELLENMFGEKKI